MSLVNPLPASGQTHTATEKRVYEPSMEDILASIRRIIADDQSLPKHPQGEETPEANLHSEQLLQPIMPSIPLPSEPVPTSSLQSVPQFMNASGAGAGAADESPATSAGLAGLDVPFQLHDFPASDRQHDHEANTSVSFPAPHGPAGDEPLTETLRPPVPPVSPTPGSFSTHSDPAPMTAERYADPPHAPRRESPDDGMALYDAPLESASSYRAKAGDRDAELFSAQTDSTVSSAFNVLAASRLASNSDELMNLAREMIRPLLRTWLDDNLPSMVERMVRAEIERVARGGR